MAGASGSGRVLRAASACRAFHADSTSHHKMPSSSSSAAAAAAGGPCHIPSLKFPSLWDTTAKRRGVGSRAAEQKAALIALGAAGMTAPERVFFPAEEASSAHLVLPLAYEVARRLVLRQLGATWQALTTRHQCWSNAAEAAIHLGVVRCQSFTLIGVAGSLVGSVPCFLEGCGAVVRSFFLQFRAMSETVDQTEIINLLIEALDMFLIGTALLTFGMGMYIMFYGSHSIQKPGIHVDKSHLGSFNLKKLKEGARIRSITQAKTRIGHAILLLLQAGVLEKFKSVPLVTGVDMACFAGAVLASSAGVFLLSKLSAQQQQCKKAFT
ncbi:hypothetical protein GUJ93_ZPchr0013g37996 [Zizania palustris]|uniref:Uncharacterized protein n=1 Tax=Zizania palustris TaxID=103762 RepID=A0A8J5WV88_ZIZPA|nr:hypothetical protein GUJ93_ZPchr0013g37996 [Zizania palustris]